jgi:hypothetical protein
VSDQCDDGHQLLQADPIDECMSGIDNSDNEEPHHANLQEQLASLKPADLVSQN